MKYHRIEVVENVTFAELATNDSERLRLKQALDKHGANGWSAVHFEQVGKRLLVFMVCEAGE